MEKMLSGISSIRNELIADIFLKMGIVEKWGTGIKRVRELCQESGLSDVEYSADEDFFTAVVHRPKKFPKVPQSSPKFSKSSPKVPRSSPKVHPKFPEVPQKFTQSSPKFPKSSPKVSRKRYQKMRY